MERVVAVDPGRHKCGLAVFDHGQLVKQDVVARSDVMAAIEPLLTAGSLVVVGDRTGSKKFVSEICSRFGIMESRIVLVDEHRSSEEARRRYWRENRPRGLRKLLPLGMQVPPEPVDDYVAVLLGERYLQANK